MTLLLLAGLALCALLSPANGIDVSLNLPPRLMWGWVPDTLSGYCGETYVQQIAHK